MTILNINFTKISAEKKETPKDKITINNNISLKDVEKIEMATISKQEAIKVKFELLAKYEPDFAEIKIIGDLVYLDSPVKIKQVVDGWKKNKNLPKDVFEQVMNVALTKSNVQALILSQTINVPPPIQLPKIEVKKD